MKFVDVRFRGQNNFRGLVLGYSIGGTFEGIAGKRLDGTRFSWGFRISWGLNGSRPYLFCFLNERS